MFDTETNFAARGFIGGLPPMLEPLRILPVLGSVRPLAILVKPSHLAPLRRSFFCVVVSAFRQETNGSARRLVDGLPPMLSPFPRYIVLCGLDGRRQVPLEAQLSPALTGGAFSVRRVGFPTQQQMASRPVDAAGLLVV